MRKILLPVLALLAASFTTNAQTDVSGTYEGELNISISGSPLEPQEQSVILAKEDGLETYEVSVENLTISMGPSSIPIGTIAIGGIEATEAGGVVTLTREGSVSVPESPVPGTTASLGTSSVTGNTLTLTLNVEVPGIDDVVLVAFEGDKEGVSAIFSPKAVKVTVYPTVVGVEGLINVVDAEAGEYVVFSQNGATVKAGKFNAGSINVSDLNAGVYVLSVNGATATFIKK